MTNTELSYHCHPILFLARLGLQTCSGLCDRSDPDVTIGLWRAERMADDDDCAAVKQKLSLHFKPVKLTPYLVYTFRKTEQLPNETLDGFATRLRTLAKG